MTTAQKWPQVEYGYRRSDWSEVKECPSAALAYHAGRWMGHTELISDGLWPDDGSDALWAFPLRRGEWVKRNEDGSWPTPPPESGGVHVIWDDGMEVIWRGTGHCCGHRSDIVIRQLVAWCLPPPLP